jgi:hypothetical protein
LLRFSEQAHLSFTWREMSYRLDLLFERLDLFLEPRFDRRDFDFDFDRLREDFEGFRDVFRFFFFVLFRLDREDFFGRTAFDDRTFRGARDRREEDLLDFFAFDFFLFFDGDRRGFLGFAIVPVRSANGILAVF